jgi:ABC-type glycerol-3-phosphate transport system substrate-binding protein
MWWVWDGFYGALRGDEEFWNDQVAAFSPLPQGPENAETSIGAWGWSINAYSTKKEFAREWVEFSSRPEIMRLQMLRGNAPARVSLWSDEEYQELAPQLPYLADLAELNVLQARPISPGVQAIYDAAEANIHAYLTDQIDVDTAIERAMEEIAPIREEYSDSGA